RWRQATIASPAGPWTKESGRGSSWADSSRARDGGLADRGDRGLHRRDHRLVVGLAEDRAAGHEGVGVGGGDLADVVRLDPAVDFAPDRPAAGVDHFPLPGQLV